MSDNFECPTELQFDRITDIVRSIEIVYKYQIRYKKLITDIRDLDHIEEAIERARA